MASTSPPENQAGHLAKISDDQDPRCFFSAFLAAFRSFAAAAAGVRSVGRVGSGGAERRPGLGQGKGGLLPRCMLKSCSQASQQCAFQGCCTQSTQPPRGRHTPGQAPHLPPLTPAAAHLRDRAGVAPP